MPSAGCEISTRSRGASRLRARLSVGLVAVLLTLAASAPSTASAAPGDQLGVYAGSGKTTAAAAFGSRVSRRLSYAHDFLARESWAAMNDMAWLAEGWRNAGYTSNLVITVPMIPDTGGSLAAGAGGAYNEHFRTLAQTLVREGQGSVVLRLGQEFNGDWFAWSIGVPDGGPLYAAYWRQIVNTMRSVAGANFRFDWCPNGGSSWVGPRQLEAETAWPGDAYVDYIGLDVYDQSWASWKGSASARWNEYVNNKNGLRWHADFAARHNKPMTFPEWGLADRTDANSGGDAPYFVEQMYWWIFQHRFAYHLYFESADPNGQYGVFSGRFPNAAETFIECFGPNGPTVPPPPTVFPPLPRPPQPPGGTPGGQHGPTPNIDASGAPARASASSTGSTGSTGADAAKLSIARARVMSRERAFDLLAPISKLASGSAAITLHAGGKRTRFSARIDRARGQIKLRKRLAGKQSNAGQGIVTVDYKGNADTQPSSVRLRAASGKARLTGQRPRLEKGRLRARGTIDKRARGVVRVQLVHTTGGERVVRELTAPIKGGRWNLNAALPASAVAQIDQRDGTLHSYTLFTGYLPAEMRGEMRSAQVLGRR